MNVILDDNYLAGQVESMGYASREKAVKTAALRLRSAMPRAITLKPVIPTTSGTSVIGLSVVMTSPSPSGKT